MPGVDELATLVSRLEAVADRLEGAGGASSGEASASLAGFDSTVLPAFQLFFQLSAKVGGDAGKMGVLVEEALKEQRKFIEVAAKAKQPASSSIQTLLKPTSDKINQIQEFREKSRRSDHFNHLSCISESIPALGWVAVAPAPAPFVKEMNDAGQFYSNRVLKEWKEKDKVHAEWVKAWVGALGELQAYVKQFHTTGLVWNPKGADWQTVMPAAASAGGPPPPPAAPAGPPPPPIGGLDLSAPAPSGDSGRGALLEALNKGSDITKGLKKVNKDQMTHKNPALRGEGLIKAADGPKGKTFGGSGGPVNKPPKLELEGKKWIVEYQKEKGKVLEISECEVNQSVYAFRCEGVTVKVNGKVNNIVIDSCKKVAVVFESVVSSCEFVNCQSVQMQVMGSVPTISVDKTDGCQMYLSKDALATEIISAKSSEMNVSIPTDDDDFVEQPVPEQFKTTIVGTKLKTSATESV